MYGDIGTTWKPCDNTDPEPHPPECQIRQVWGWGLRICMSNKLPGGADRRFSGTVLRELQLPNLPRQSDPECLVQTPSHSLTPDTSDGLFGRETQESVFLINSPK